MIDGMVRGLEDRLATQGGSPEEWARLISALAVKERTGACAGHPDRGAQRVRRRPAGAGHHRRRRRTGRAAMICAAIEDFAAALPRAGAIAGLDLGTKTIGVAVSDGLRGVASPLTVIRRVKVHRRCRGAAEDHRRPGAGRVWCWACRATWTGSEGPRAQSTRAFARNLERLTPLPIGLLGRTAVHRRRRTRPA